MTKNIKKLEREINSLYNKFKNDNELKKYLIEKNYVASVDKKRDEIYNTSETYYEVARKGKYIDNHGDVLYGLRLRLQNKKGMERIKSILSKSKYNPDKVITKVKENIGYIEVTIELFNVEQILQN